MLYTRRRDMSASHQFPSMHAAASHTLGALERYHRGVRRLADDWLDMELYGAVARDIDAVRNGCAQVQPLSRSWVELLIAHAEFIQALWQSSRPQSPVTPADRQRLLRKVSDSVDGLQAACMALVSPGG